MKFTCIAVDDNGGALKKTVRLIERTPCLRLLYSFTDPVETLDYVLKHKPDILFVDIDMPELSGWGIIQAVKENKLITRIIITTSHVQYGKEGFDYKVDDFLLKPATHERFLEAVDTARMKLFLRHFARPEEDAVLQQTTKFKDNGTGISEQLKIGQIDSLDVEGSITCIRAGESTIQVAASLTQVLQQLPATHFIRVNYNEAIAVFKIEKYIGSQITLMNDKVFEVSRNYKPEVDQLLRGESG
jgi:two-component system, LytTR family, response regulator